MPKAASTSWLHAFLKLANVPDHLIPEDNGMGLHAFLRDKYPLLSKNLNKQFMTKSVKFVVVRHPFERIVSAYLDKLHSYARVRTNILLPLLKIPDYEPKSSLLGLEVQRGLLLCNVWGRHSQHVSAKIPGE